MIKKYSYGIIPILKTGDGNIEVLLIKSQSGGHRGFPKGYQETGETQLQTATRELQEETGLKVKKIIKIDITENYIDYNTLKSQLKNIDKQVGYFVGYVDTQIIKIQKSEIQEYKRISIEKVENNLTYDSSKQIFQQAKKIILNS